MSSPISVLSVVSKYGTPPPGLWTLAEKIGMNSPVSVKDLVGKLEPANYSFSMPIFHIAMMRTGHAKSKDGSDTDYVSLSVKVKGQPISTVTKSVGNQTGGDVLVGLSIPNFEVLATDNVYLQYSIINSGQPPSAAISFLENVGSQLLAAAEKADLAYMSKVAGPLSPVVGLGISLLNSQEQGALIGAQLGNAVGSMVGGVVLPGIGVVIGALAGWFASNLVEFLCPDCDGPVAVGLRVFNGAQLRQLTQNCVYGVYTTTDDNPGVDSAQGCGENSSYQVTWELAKN